MLDMRAHPRAVRSRPTAGAGLLLELIRSERAVTKVELAEASGFARATVNDRLELLLESGLLASAPPKRSTGGRRPAAYALNEEAGVILVAALGASAVRFACCNLGATVLADEREPIDITAGPTVVLEIARRGLAAVLEAAGRAVDDVRGVTLGVPGPVDFANGRVVSPWTTSGWDGLDIRGALALPYPGPFLVENDVNLMALGEHRAVLRGDEDCIFLKVGTGVGCGIVVFGRLYRGAVGGAGDIGHIRGDGLDDVCRCGNRGCVEAAAGGWALARDLRERGRDVSSPADVVELLRANDQDSVELAARAGRVLGAAVADAVSLLNPSVIVLGGQIAHADERMLDRIREVVYSRSLPLVTRALRLQMSSLGDHAGVIGGAHLMLEHVFAPEAVDRALAAGDGAQKGARRPVAAGQDV
jgi:predicted NBD/HSP70 family sugar kinase